MSLRRSARLARVPSSPDALTSVVSTTASQTTVLAAKVSSSSSSSEEGATSNKPSGQKPRSTRSTKRKAENATTTTGTTKLQITDTETSPAVTPSPSTRNKKPKTSAAAAANAATPDGKKKKSPQRKKKNPPPAPGSKTPPVGWEEIYSLVEELRQDRSAPVDHAGAEVLPEKYKDPNVFRFQVLIALMLSSQTKDAVVGDAMRQLQQHGLTIENIAKTDSKTLNQLIQKVGFHNNKTKYIHQTVEILLEKYNGDIPKTAQEMIDDLPGVGAKMAFLVGKSLSMHF